MSLVPHAPSTVQAAVSLMDIPASRSASPENAVVGWDEADRPRPVVDDRPRFDVAKVRWLG